MEGFTESKDSGNLLVIDLGLKVGGARKAIGRPLPRGNQSRWGLWGKPTRAHISYGLSLWFSATRSGVSISNALCLWFTTASKPSVQTIERDQQWKAQLMEIVLQFPAHNHVSSTSVIENTRHCLEGRRTPKENDIIAFPRIPRTLL